MLLPGGLHAVVHQPPIGVAALRAARLPTVRLQTGLQAPNLWVGRLTPCLSPLLFTPSASRGPRCLPAMSTSSSSFQGASVEELDSWLRQQQIDTSEWGKGSSKPVSLLWQEVQDGETVLTLSGGRLLRQVSVLNVLIRDASGRCLVEHQQVLPTGSVRTRGLPLSEKLLPGETWQAAVARAVEEELGPVLPAGGPRIEIDAASYRLETEEKESQSYPGVASRYCCHRVDARVAGLPEGPFETTEQRADGPLRHVWIWR